VPTPDPVSRPVARPVSRRTTLVGLAGVAGLTGWLASGCTSDQPDAGPDPSPSAGATGRQTAAVKPDVRLAATVLGVEQAMLDRVLAIGRRHPRLHDRLGDARAAHREHVRLLASAVPAGSRPARTPRRARPVPGSPAAALAALARAEDRLARADRRSALAAESGAFARALGTMAAAAAQLAVAASPATGTGQDAR
jgi:hypothetical protein